MARDNHIYSPQIMYWHVATSAEASANTLDMVIYEAPLPTSEFIYMIQIERSGVVVTADADHSYSKTTGKLTVADGSTYNITAGDIVKVLGFFYGTALN